MPSQSKNYNLLYFNNKADNKRQQTITVDYKRLFTDFVLTRVVTLHRQTMVRQAHQPTMWRHNKSNLLLFTKHTHHEYNEKLGHLDWPPGCRT